MRIEFVTEIGCARIVYSMKIVDDLATTMTCRKELHSKLYQHKTNVALDCQFVDILALANDHLLFSAADGRMYRMSDAMKDMSAYYKVCDGVFDLVCLDMLG